MSREIRFRQFLTSLSGSKVRIETKFAVIDCVVEWVPALNGFCSPTSHAADPDANPKVQVTLKPEHIREFSGIPTEDGRIYWTLKCW